MYPNLSSAGDALAASVILSQIVVNGIHLPENLEFFQSLIEGFILSSAYIKMQYALANCND